MTHMNLSSQVISCTIIFNELYMNVQEKRAVDFNFTWVIKLWSQDTFCLYLSLMNGLRNQHICTKPDPNSNKTVMQTKQDAPTQKGKLFKTQE